MIEEDARRVEIMAYWLLPSACYFSASIRSPKMLPQLADDADVIARCTTPQLPAICRRRGYRQACTTPHLAASPHH